MVYSSITYTQNIPQVKGASLLNIPLSTVIGQFALVIQIYDLCSRKIDWRVLCSQSLLLIRFVSVYMLTISLSTMECLRLYFTEWNTFANILFSLNLTKTIVDLFSFLLFNIISASRLFFIWLRRIVVVPSEILLICWARETIASWESDANNKLFNYRDRCSQHAAGKKLKQRHSVFQRQHQDGAHHRKIGSDEGVKQKKSSSQQTLPNSQFFVTCETYL